MRRILLLLVAGLTLLAWFAFPRGPEPAVATPSEFSTVSFAAVRAPVELPRPKFTRTIYAATHLAGASVMLDACAGPIAVDLGGSRPVLVAEHNYCGGSAWIPHVNMGDAVELKGDGIEPGTYVVTEIRFQLRHEAIVRDLPAADAVLQTCVTKEKMILVGLNRLDPVTGLP